MTRLLSFLSFIVAFSAMSFFPDPADAASRFGGGRSSGMQRQITPQQAPRAPAQQQAAPSKQQATPATPPAQPQTGWRRWLGPLAGLALGAGLASLFFNNGMGGALMGILMVGAIIFGLMLLVRMFRGGRPQPNQPMQYAGAGANAPRAEPRFEPQPGSVGSADWGGGAAAHSVAAATQWPAGFDADEFARHAKQNFVKLQDANDRHDVDALRDFLTPELLDEMSGEMRAAAGKAQKTDVVTLEADVLDVVAENGHYVVSVRFSGLIRENGETEPQPFSEIWHLQKPISGRTGWLVAGIQQT